MRVAFFGLPLAALLLQEDGIDVPLAVLSPVEHPGRRRLRKRLAPGVVLVDGLDGVPPTPALTALVAAARVDLIVSWFWTRKLPPEVLAQAPRGGIGAHPSLLPRHRGPNPFFWAIDQGDAVTGVTVHELDVDYDTGRILAQERLRVADRDSWQLARALDRPSLRCLRQVVGAHVAGAPPTPQPQDERQARWAPDPTGVALKVDWAWPTFRVLRRIRALSPTPGLAIELGGQRLFVVRASETYRFPRALLPGEAARVEGVVVVRTGDGAVRLDQAEGGHLARYGVRSTWTARHLGKLVPDSGLDACVDPHLSGSPRRS